MLAFFAFCSNSISADLKVVPDTTIGLVGDQIKIKMTAELPNGVEWSWPEAVDTNGRVEILSVSDTDTLSVGDKESQYTQTVTISAYDSVDVVFQDFVIAYQREGISGPNILKAPGFTLAFSTVAVDTSKPFLDIKELKDVEIERENSLWIWIIVCLAILSFIIFYIWFIKKQSKRTTVSISKPKDPPYSVAIKKLNEVQNNAYWKKGNPKKHHSELSIILKEYFEAVHKSNTTDMTTSEFSRWLKSSGYGGQQTDAAIASMELGDLVKFAKYEPEAIENTTAEENVRNLIEFAHKKSDVASIGANPDNTIERDIQSDMSTDGGNK
ncbi:MAG: hypothetical protein Kapaf2KO_15160 [Candidatus Kapaibacteriales bacterium]